MKFISIETSINKKSNKLDFDKYYTPKDIMQHCVHTTINKLNELGYTITEYLEPSAGNGVFSKYIKSLGYDITSIDIQPEFDGCIQGDYLVYSLDYVSGRCIIGNPPFGARLNLAQKFYKKSIEVGDYISFILPISQLNNSRTMYEFDLVYSEDLGKVTFSGNRKIHSCLNIYVRNKQGINSKPISKLKDITIVRQDSSKFPNMEYDLRMCCWGASIGKLLVDGENYSSEYKIKINNTQLKDKIISVLTNVDWHKELNFTGVPKLQQFHIIDLLKKHIEDIK